jgi:hypothetical protein
MCFEVGLKEAMIRFVACTLILTSTRWLSGAAAIFLKMKKDQTSDV